MMHEEYFVVSLIRLLPFKTDAASCFISADRNAKHFELFFEQHATIWRLDSDFSPTSECISDSHPATNIQVESNKFNESKMSETVGPCFCPHICVKTPQINVPSKIIFSFGCLPFYRINHEKTQ